MRARPVWWLNHKQQDDKESLLDHFGLAEAATIYNEGDAPLILGLVSREKDKPKFKATLTIREVVELGFFETSEEAIAAVVTAAVNDKRSPPKHYGMNNRPLRKTTYTPTVVEAEMYS